MTHIIVAHDLWTFDALADVGRPVCIAVNAGTDAIGQHIWLRLLGWDTTGLPLTFNARLQPQLLSDPALLLSEHEQELVNSGGNASMGWWTSIEEVAEELQGTIRGALAEDFLLGGATFAPDNPESLLPNDATVGWELGHHPDVGQLLHDLTRGYFLLYSDFFHESLEAGEISRGG